MKADDNIRYIAIGNLVDRTIPIEYASQSKREKVSKLQTAAQDILEKLLLISITANERHTESMNGEIKGVEDLVKISGFPIDKVDLIALYLEF